MATLAQSWMRIACSARSEATLKDMMPVVAVRPDFAATERTTLDDDAFIRGRLGLHAPGPSGRRP